MNKKEGLVVGGGDNAEMQGYFVRRRVRLRIGRARSAMSDEKFEWGTGAASFPLVRLGSSRCLPGSRTSKAAHQQGSAPTKKVEWGISGAQNFWTSNARTAPLTALRIHLNTPAHCPAHSHSHEAEGCRQNGWFSWAIQTPTNRASRQRCRLSHGSS